MNPLVVIPARLAATRLPGKPLADIHGEPMIVHVWRRAMAAGIGPVLVAAGESPRSRAPSKPRAAARVLTRPDHPSGSDRVFEAVEAADPQGRHDVWSICRATCRRSIRPLIARVLAPLADPAVDIATHRHRDPRAGGDATTPTWSRPWRRSAADTAGSRARSISPARAARRARGRSSTISASTPIAARRSPASSHLPPAPPGAAREAGAAARARSRHAHRRGAR